MKSKSLFVTTALCLMAAIGVFAQPAIQVTAITGQAGTYAVGDLVTFEFTMTNAAELEELLEVPADPIAAAVSSS